MIFSNLKKSLLTEIHKNSKLMDKIKKSNPDTYAEMKEWRVLNERNILLTQQFNEI